MVYNIVFIIIIAFIFFGLEALSSFPTQTKENKKSICRMFISAVTLPIAMILHMVILLLIIWISGIEIYGPYQIIAALIIPFVINLAIFYFIIKKHYKIESFKFFDDTIVLIIKCFRNLSIGILIFWTMFLSNLIPITSDIIFFDFLSTSNNLVYEKSSKNDDAKQQKDSVDTFIKQQKNQVAYKDIHKDAFSSIDFYLKTTPAFLGAYFIFVDLDDFFYKKKKKKS